MSAQHAHCVFLQPFFFIVVGVAILQKIGARAYAIDTAIWTLVPPLICPYTNVNVYVQLKAVHCLTQSGKYSIN